MDDPVDSRQNRALDQLDAFVVANRFRGRKGPLSVALFVTELARKNGLPLRSEELITEGGGQVLGLGKAPVQKILERHGITRVLAKEAGRTSRGSIGNMQRYVDFLNGLHSTGTVELSTIEAFWIECVNEFFAAKPFKIQLDASRSLRGVVRDVIAQAVDRQKKAQGSRYAGAVLQHLVGAKLECALGTGMVEHNSFSTSDDQSGRPGDFLIGDVVIHVTTSPNEGVIERCADNLRDGLRPMLVTLQRGLPVADVLSDDRNLADRIDVFEIEQFLAINLYELGKFAAEGRKVAVQDLVERYNQIVDDCETDPSLRIEFRR